MTQLARATQECSEKLTEVLALQQELVAAKQRVGDLEAQCDQQREELGRVAQARTNCENDLTDAKNRLKQFESLSDNLEILEKTKKQLEQLQRERGPLKKAVEEGAAAIEQLEQLRREKDELSVEVTGLQSSLYDAETALLQAGLTVAKKPSGQRSILDEMRQCIKELVYLYKTVHTLAKDLLTLYVGKKEKVQEFMAFIDSYTKLSSKDEKLRSLYGLPEAGFGFVAGVPKRTQNLPLLEACVQRTIQLKRNKLPFYEDQISKYTQLTQVSATKHVEYERKLV